MTTIATDGREIAADGRVMRRETVVADGSEKLARLADGSVVGCSGQTIDGEDFRAWLAKGDGKRPRPSSAFSAMVLSAGGEVMLYSDTGAGCVVDAPAAIGSGGDLALGAMLAGASPGEAVRIAAERDPFTGGNITALTL